ncbi:MAG: RluA family pseudouridine synthase [Sphingosinicella sp.]
MTDRVLFIDGEAIVLDKPAGLAVHPGPKTRESLENHLDSLCFGFARLPSVVHRLDRDTSGCLLLARNPKAHRRFALAFEQGLVEKVYLAVLAGEPEDEEGVIELALKKTSSRAAGWRMVADPAGQPASTEWRRLAVRGGRALVEFRPRTGRTHQVRAHAALGLGCAIEGDPIYGQPGGPMLLHALSLHVPRSNKPAIAARAPWPAAFFEMGFSDAG